MRIVPPIRPIRDGKILDTNLINHIIQRTEYGAELLARYKMVAGTNIFVEQAGNGLGVSYLTALAGGAGTGSGGAGTGSGGAGTGTGGAGTGSGGSGTPEPVQPTTEPYKVVGNYVLGGVTRGFVYDGTTYVDIFVPGSTSTACVAIDGNNITGICFIGGIRKVYIYNGSIYNSITIPSGSPGAIVRDINNGYAVGSRFSIGGFLSEGFITDGLTFTAYNAFNSNITEFFAIDNNNIVGVSTAFSRRGFLFNGTTYTEIGFPAGSNVTVPIDIDGNNVVGYYQDSGSLILRGFLYNGTTYTDIFFPSGTSTSPSEIDGNNIVGTYVSGSSQSRGFLFNGSLYKDIFPPNATSLQGIGGIKGNNVVGTYSNGSQLLGFLYNGSSYSDILVPGSTSTGIVGITNN